MKTRIGAKSCRFILYPVSGPAKGRDSQKKTPGISAGGSQLKLEVRKSGVLVFERCDPDVCPEDEGGVNNQSDHEVKTRIAPESCTSCSRI
ncbi:MAG TPA: hypothetical protein VMM36_19045 [Opitutaceae bacterium]|nr:hypothetical protein [Opitutaceae bacterium]